MNKEICLSDCYFCPCGQLMKLIAIYKTRCMITKKKDLETSRMATLFYPADTYRATKESIITSSR